MRKDSITSISLEAHLNKTARNHKGKKYHDLLEMIENQATISYMSRVFGVSRRTIYKWLLMVKK